MAPRRRLSSGIFGVRERPSGRFTAEITTDGVRWCIGTFDSAELAARAYDAMAIRFGRPRRDLNFPDTEREYALWLAPSLHFVVVMDGHEHRRQQWRERQNLRAAQIDELRMEKLHRDHPSSCTGSSTSSPGGRKEGRRRPSRPCGAVRSTAAASEPHQCRVLVVVVIARLLVLGLRLRRARPGLGAAVD
ncbi:hypothetical protein ZWY2020_006004 [Hordeum vulgare]|nr:hypothetical protein ZWY2020_006004 [Hordeum vulgare]